MTMVAIVVIMIAINIGRTIIMIKTRILITIIVKNNLLLLHSSSNNNRNPGLRKFGGVKGAKVAKGDLGRLGA